MIAVPVTSGCRYDVVDLEVYLVERLVDMPGALAHQRVAVPPAHA